MELPEPLEKRERGHQIVLVITDRFCTLVCSLPLRSTASTSVANAVLDHVVYAYVVPVCVLTDNGRQFFAKLSNAVCAVLVLKHYLNTVYHRQTNAQIDRSNKTIVQRLYH